jgi:hypothetical protein
MEALAVRLSQMDSQAEGEEMGTVLLERPSAPGSLDELLLDRVAIAAVRGARLARSTAAYPVEAVQASGVQNVG